MPLYSYSTSQFRNFSRKYWILCGDVNLPTSNMDKWQRSPGVMRVALSLCVSRPARRKSLDYSRRCIIGHGRQFFQRLDTKRERKLSSYQQQDTIISFSREKKNFRSLSGESKRSSFQRTISEMEFSNGII